jgi:hypothetical protein
VFVDQLSDAPPVAQQQVVPGSSPPKAAVRVRSGGGNLSQALDEFATPVDGGHLITTSLLSIFITQDNRLLVGAVTPQYIEHLAATGTGQ